MEAMLQMDYRYRKRMKLVSRIRIGGSNEYWEVKSMKKRNFLRKPLEILQKTVYYYLLLATKATKHLKATDL